MDKIKLYIDFDGVILDTIRVTYEMIEERKLMTRPEIEHFYKTLDWTHLVNTTPILNDGINCIKRLIVSNIYDITILTHVNSNHEAEVKVEYLGEQLPGTEVITCPKTIDKCDFVDPTNAVLVDDYLGNLVPWQAKSGIPVKFSDNNKKNDEFVTITKLDQLMEKRVIDVIMGMLQDKGRTRVRGYKAVSLN